MIMGILLRVVFFVICNGSVFGQIKWYKTPNVRENGDSMYYYLTTKHYYNYFYQRYDSLDNDFEGDTTNNIVLQELIVDKISQSGILSITYKGRTLVDYEIKHHKVNGIGRSYNSLMKDANGIPIRQGQFKDGLLDGFYIDSYTNGEVVAVLLYKKGKLKDVIYGFGYSSEYFKKHFKYP